MMKTAFLTIALAALLISPVQAQETVKPDILQANLVNGFGQGTGTATFRRAAKGTIIRIEATGLPGGWHGLHLHGVGDCSDHLDHFAKSGVHAADLGQQHGYLNPEGPHSGDLPNLFVALDGSATVELYTADMKFDNLSDADGSALMIHAGPDDYTSQPAGESGERLACGVVTQKK